MDEIGFQKYMQDQKKSERTVARYTKGMRIVANYLWKHGPKKRIEDISPEDVKDFESWSAARFKTLNQCIWAIKVYAEFTDNHTLWMASNEILGSRYASRYKLKDFMGVAQKDVSRLHKSGIKTVAQMLEAGRTRRDREHLAAETGLADGVILEIVKLSDLARIPGLRKVRARLYFDAGLDTVEKIAKMEPTELIERLSDFIGRTGFKGIAPLPKEAKSAVSTARYIARIVEY